MKQISVYIAAIAMIFENACGMLIQQNENRSDITEVQESINLNNDSVVRSNANGYYVLSDGQRVEIPFGTTDICRKIFLAT